MTDIISEARIAAMIAERKEMSEDWRQELANLKNRVGRHETEVDLTGTGGTPFRILISLRHSSPENFTVILMLNSPTHPNFPLLRYDGGSHDHRNRLEGNRIIRRPHIHRATERYQIATYQRRPDGYAEETKRYQDLAGAWDCFRSDANLAFPDDDASRLLPPPFTR
ncbi:MAG: hypothetical protein F4W95_05325 [Chloroflexi bacterium]|nr:hypothetical protein [Chloroflexota bacterium]MYD47888.1 hypothetical protein [Chloroflexota bacterium]